jgi:hypothetical protein
MQSDPSLRVIRIPGRGAFCFVVLWPSIASVEGVLQECVESGGDRCSFSHEAFAARRHPTAGVDSLYIYISDSATGVY